MPGAWRCLCRQSRQHDVSVLELIDMQKEKGSNRLPFFTLMRNDQLCIGSAYQEGSCSADLIPLLVVDRVAESNRAS